MNHSELVAAKQSLREQGSLGALRKIVEYKHTESLEQLLLTKDDHRWHQSRVSAFNEILELLPDSP